MRRTVPPQAYFVVSAVFHYLGPALAVLLFARIAPLGVAWVRIAAAGLIFALWRRPWRAWRILDPGTRRLVVAWGAVLAVMNCCFYLAIDRIPLGTVAAAEFAPVVVLAAIAVRSLRNLLAVLLAVVGVYLLTDIRLSHDWVGLVFTALNAILFAAYVVLGHRVSRAAGLRRIDGLALAMATATVLALPIGAWAAVPAFTDLRLLGAAIGVGVCSSVIPYVADQLAMARLKRSTFAVMLALLPATATVIGAVVLRQFPQAAELLAVAIIVVAVGLHREAT
ncbi:inner membrane transporter RhtA [Kribbella aluminosa]|uniref:Inner membrane transporter RhtA n=1 Tax=Kribbella aluminosa TaxID=416017 RepID=A0ABS4UTM9_9ACTN|nr:EamA family transporter [Kribbella aluminosa]MBP2354909.1 inner membrane transporter RhtA [Kribbella aluminosa]